MKLRCGKEDLVGRIQIVMRAVSAKSSLPTLTGVHMSVEGDKVMLCGTDLEVSIRAELPASVEEPGTTVIPARFFSEIARALPEATVGLRASNGAVEVECEKSNFNLRSLPPEEFPLPAVAEWEESITFSVADFCEGARRVVRAASRDDSRPILTGIAMRIKDGQWELAATDSYRLAVVTGSLSGKSPELEAVVPARVLEEVVRIASSEGADRILVSLGENEARFKVGSVELTCRLLDGSYPAYKQLIPETFGVEIEGDRESFLSAARRVSIVANGSPLLLEVGKGRMRLSAKNRDVGEVTEELQVEQTGEDVQIAFNAQFLVDGLTVLPGSKVRLFLNSAMKPGLLRSADDDTFRYLIMPVRTS